MTTTLFDYVHPNISQSAFNFHEFVYQHIKKNHLNSSICSGDIPDIKKLQSDWLKLFWPITQEPFSQIWDLCWNTTKNTNFQYKTYQKKLMIKFFSNFKQHDFWPLWVQFVFSIEHGCHTHRFLTQCLHIEKTSNSIPRKHRRQTGGRTDPILQDTSGDHWGSKNVSKKFHTLRDYLKTQMLFSRNLAEHSQLKFNNKSK